jgi:ketosteroid isomerase-like protein
MADPISRDRAAAFYDALATRDPDRIAPFLDDDVDWLLVGPVELFAFCGQHIGKAAVLDVFRRISQTEEAHGNVREYLLVDDDCAAALTRISNVETRTGHAINFRVAHFARFRHDKVIDYCGIPDSLGKVEQTLGHPLDLALVPAS